MSSDGIRQPLGRVDVAHVRGDARARLRQALELELAVGLLERGQVDAVGNRAHQLVEHVHDLGTAALELLDDLDARAQPLLLLLEREDLGDLLVELRDLVVQVLVALVLVVDRRAHLQVHEERDRTGGDQRAERADAEFLALALALGLAPGD